MLSGAVAVTDRNDWVDYAKAIGIILVVYGHVARGLYKAGIFTATYLFELIDSVIYTFHMPLFFFLSGLFFYSSFAKRGGKALVWNKIDTVFYPYVLWSILQGCMEVLLSGFTNGDASFRDVFSLLWAPRAQLWFLYALFLIFLVASVIYSFASKSHTLLVFALSALLYVFSSHWRDFLILKYISENLVFFVLGVVFTMYFRIEYFASAWRCLGLALLFVLAQWIFHGYFSLRFTDRGIESLILALLSIAFVISVSSGLATRHYGFLTYIGSSSMAIYLMHILASGGVRAVLNKLFHTDSLAVHLVVGCLVSFFAPLIALAIINKARIPYVFSAPVSAWVAGLQHKALQRSSR